MDSAPEGHYEAMVDLCESMKEDGFHTWLDKIKLQEMWKERASKTSTASNDELFGSPLRWEVFDPPVALRKECKKRGYEFTVGKQYPIFYEVEDNHTGMLYVTEDDGGDRRSLNSIHFNVKIETTYIKAYGPKRLDINKNIYPQMNKIYDSYIRKEIHGRRQKYRR